MSRASNSLLVSDVTATPIKLKYSSSYSNTTICDSGIYAQSGLNGPVTVTGSVPQRTLRYWSIRHLFYSNFLTGSYLTTTSSLDNFLQSTAASGTFEGNTTLSASTDLRYFPTESLSKVKIINIPKNTFGEKVSRKSFFLTGSDYAIADDGNGNVYDTTTKIHVGNIIYPQGFVVITNPDYYCAMDGGPFTFPKTYVFDISDNPKTFNPITDAQPDCAPVDTSTLTLITASGWLFPSSSQDNLGNVTLSSTDTLSTRVGYYRDYYTVKSTYCASSDKQPINLKLIDCTIVGLTASFIPPSPTPTPTVTPTPTPTNTPTVTPTITPSPTVTPSITASPGTTPTPSPTVTPTKTPSPTETPTPSVSGYSLVVKWKIASSAFTTGNIAWSLDGGSTWNTQLANIGNLTSGYLTAITLNGLASNASVQVGIQNNASVNVTFGVGSGGSYTGYCGESSPYTYTLAGANATVYLNADETGTPGTLQIC